VNSGFWRPAPLCKRQSLHVDGVPENTGTFERFGTFRTGRFGTGFLQRRQCFGFEIDLGRGILIGLDIDMTLRLGVAFSE
jgi:hypothetical protein